MPTPTLVATAGATNANSYITVADADTYHDAHLYASTWTAATTANKTIGLIWATRLIDAAYEFVGEIASDTQALRWPRAATYDRDGRLLANDAIPAELENATAELARHLLAADRTAPASATDAAVKRAKVGGLEVEFANGFSTREDAIPDTVFEMLRHLVLNKTKYGAISMRRG
jgi:hypothetical protein